MNHTEDERDLAIAEHGRQHENRVEARRKQRARREEAKKERGLRFVIERLCQPTRL